MNANSLLKKLIKVIFFIIAENVIKYKYLNKFLFVQLSNHLVLSCKLLIN